MKKIMGCFILFILMCVLVYGNGQQEVEKTGKIAFSCGQEIEERWQREIAMFEKYFDTEGIDFFYQTAGYDSNRQISQCENFFARGVDILIITPADADACAVIADSAKESGAVVIVYDQPLNSKNVDYLVTFDAVETGELIASYVYDKASTGNYIILYGDPANMNAQNIKIGNFNILGESISKGQINVVMEQWVKNWDPNIALSFVENALTANNNDIQGIITPNDGTAGGAIQALVTQGLAGEIPICGQDADLAACQRVVEGTQAMTVYKNLIKLNAATCQISSAVISGHDPKVNIDRALGEWTTFEVKDGSIIDMFRPAQIPITKDNIVKEIIDTGFHSFEDVYRNIPENERPHRG